MLTLVAVVPLTVFRAQATQSANPYQQVCTGETIALKGTTTENTAAITQIT